MTKTFRNTFTALAFTTALAMAQTTGAQRTPPTPEQMAAQRVTRLTELLTLTTSQQTNATAIFTAEATAMTALRPAVQTAHEALTTAVKANSASGIATAATQLGALNTREVQTRASADAAFYVLLTAEQKAKYDGFLAAGPGGRGGPGGPRGGGMAGASGFAPRARR